VKFANFVYNCITHSKNNHFGSKMVMFPVRNANIYKICELHRAIFSSFYNNSQPNFAILLILRCLSSYGNGFRSSCLDQNFVHSWNHLLHFTIFSGMTHSVNVGLLMTE
jgi:hypothetical protein